MAPEEVARELNRLANVEYKEGLRAIRDVINPGDDEYAAAYWTGALWAFGTHGDAAYRVGYRAGAAFAYRRAAVLVSAVQQGQP